MSFASVGTIQVGKSTTNDETFSFSAPNDGTMVLKRGGFALPLSTVITVEADDSVNFPSGTSGPILGSGGTIQNLLGSRLANTTYINTSGTFKVVAVSTNYSTTLSSLLVDGVTHSVCLGNGTLAFSTAVAIVPPGSEYRFNCAGALTTWTEINL